MGGRVFITGGSGFIGSHFVRACLNQGFQVLNFDALTYSAVPGTLLDIEHNPNYMMIKGHVEDRAKLEFAFQNFEPDKVVHFAAESHVDHSIDNPIPFLETNITGTLYLLEIMRDYLSTKKQGARDTPFHYLHISTDEVYGSVTDHPFKEEDPYAPTSPYAATKAAGDHLVQSYIKTYNMPATIVNCTNNYGPNQFPEKLIPHMILCALHEQPLPIYGDGLQERNWLFVQDHIEALLTLLPGQHTNNQYNIGGRTTATNLEIVTTVAQILDQLQPRRNKQPYKSLIHHVADRLGHDQKYDLISDRIQRSTNWQQKTSLEAGLKITCQWYLQNQKWWQDILDQGYELGRLGDKSAKCA